MQELRNLAHPAAGMEEKAPLETSPKQMDLHELVLLDPVAGWRVWESTHRRDYNESSEAC